MGSTQTHKGWTKADLERVLPQLPEPAQRILAYVAQNPNCTTREMAPALGFKSERSVGPYLNGLTRASVELGVFASKDEARWPFEYGTKTDGYERYDMPAWVRAVVSQVLGSA